MILKEILRDNAELFTLTPEDRICTAAEMMRKEKIGSVIVVEDDRVVGIITDRDIALSLALGASTPDSLLIESMAVDVETIEESMTLFDVAHVFRTRRVRRLPVVDSNDRLVGLVSIDDVLATLSRELFDTCSMLEPKLGQVV